MSGSSYTICLSCSAMNNCFLLGILLGWSVQAVSLILERSERSAVACSTRSTQRPKVLHWECSPKALHRTCSLKVLHRTCSLKVLHRKCSIKVLHRMCSPNVRVRPDKVSKMTTIMFWDLAPDVGYYQVSNLLKDINGVIDISFSSTRHRAVVHFATAIAAQAALCLLTGSCLMGRPLKFAWFDKNSYDPNRDTLPAMELLPGRVPRTIYIEGFDSSLSITEIRSMLKSHFDRSRLHGRRIITPQNPDGTSTGKPS
ncbi:hypothetical protein SEVIR_6G161800v4 [Setaria viridis]|uniref:RRM domain-containing protein n=1 Tax=Setaria viridis TaxID=4556 RepID=A0A4U6U478_SETVI|nr:nucleolin 2-like [Setaria viridis]TKW10400.1 hypothetical protein SEVIR_6G161800v2 [Setaria viridis]